MPVDHAAHVRAALVHLGVQNGLEVHVPRRIRKVGLDREGEHVVGRDLAERDALALDVHHAVAREHAHMTERQVLVTLRGEDAARPRHLYRKPLVARGCCGHAVRLSVGGYVGKGKPKTIATSSPPVLATACHTPAGMKRPSPALKGTAPSSSRSSPLPLST